MTKTPQSIYSVKQGFPVSGHGKVIMKGYLGCVNRVVV